MTEGLTRVIEKSDLNAVDRRVRDALSTQGFGIVTEIDVCRTVKEKLGVEMEPYRILGACNPWLAHALLAREPKAGLLMPCNVVLRSTRAGVEIYALDPVPGVSEFHNDELHMLASEARELLSRALAAA